jgi:L-ascorbate metabolism protein UlaG (beta-lactamase superfamily)
MWNMKTAVLTLTVVAAAFAAKPPEEFQTKAGPLKVTIVQHASFYIEAGGKVVHVDPAQGDYNGVPPGDLILITDIHGDHLAPDVLAKVKKEGSVIIAPESVAKTVTEATVLRNGEVKTVGPWTIEAIPMYNLKRGPSEGKLYHDKGRGNGYVVTYGGLRIYISGDTEDIPEMRALQNIDVAFVCMNLPYTMTAEEAAVAVRAFKPKVVYPYHSKGQDTKVFEKALAGSGVEVRLRDWY